MKDISDGFKVPHLSKWADSSAIYLVPIVSLRPLNTLESKLEKALPLEYNVLFSNVF